MATLTNMSSEDLVRHVQVHGAPKSQSPSISDAHGQGGHGGHGGGHGGHGDEGRQLHHMYVPMAQKGYMMEGGKKVPVHNLHVYSRSQFLSNLIDSNFRTGGLGSAYKAYFWAVMCFIGMVLLYNVNLYLAAVMAYLTGMYWSQRLVIPPWHVTWFKGKALYHAK